jgi:hypothetical protein
MIKTNWWKISWKNAVKELRLKIKEEKPSGIWSQLAWF